MWVCVVSLPFFFSRNYCFRDKKQFYSVHMLIIYATSRCWAQRIRTTEGLDFLMCPWIYLYKRQVSALLYQSSAPQPALGRGFCLPQLPVLGKSLWVKLKGKNKASSLPPHPEGSQTPPGLWVLILCPWGQKDNLTFTANLWVNILKVCHSKGRAMLQAALACTSC